MPPLSFDERRRLVEDGMDIAADWLIAATRAILAGNLEDAKKTLDGADAIATALERLLLV